MAQQKKSDRNLPRLDETFLIGGSRQNLINVGSAYSLPKSTGAFQPRARQVNEAGWAGKLPAGQKLRPEFEKIVDEAAQDVIDMMIDSRDPRGDKKADLYHPQVVEILRDMAHAIESAEGEDPAELDRGGPKPGTTGGK